MRDDRRGWFLAGGALALLAVLALRALYSALPAPAGDGGVYLHTAGKILAGEYFFSQAPRTFDLLYRTPGYPLFLAALERLAGGSRALMVPAQHLLGVLSALLAWSLGRRLWGRAGGALAFLFAGLHFHFAYLEAYPLSEALGVFLLLLSLRLALYAGDDGGGSASLPALAGLAAGAGALCRPELAALLPLCAGYLLLARPRGERLKAALFFLLPGSLLLGSWTLRNGLLFDSWGLTPNSAITLFSGPAGDCAVKECPPADPVCTQAFASQYADGRVNRGVELLEKFGVPYHWSGRRIGTIASAAAAGEPACWAGGSLTQLKDSLFTGPTWPPRDLTENIPPLLAGSSGVAARLINALGRADGLLEGLLLGPLFLAGCLMALLRRRRAELLAAAAALALLLAYAFLSPLVPRYRVVPEALMGLLAAGSLIYAWNAARLRPAPEGEVPPLPRPLRGRLPSAALAVSGLLLAVFLAGLFRAAVLLPRRAEAVCRKAGGAQAGVCLGYQRLSRGKFPAALAAFDAALALDPSDKAAGDGRAAALFRMGSGAGALAELERGLKLQGPSPDILFNMAVIEHLSGSPAAAGRLDALLKRRDLPPVIRAAAAEMRRAGPPSFTSRRPIE